MTTTKSNFIMDEIRGGTKSQGYELRAQDLGRPLAPAWGKVMDCDVGKRCWIKPWGFAMENDEQAARRKVP